MSVWIGAVLWVFGGVTVAGLLAAALHSPRPLRSLLGSSLQGLCALGTVDLLALFTGVSLGAGYLPVGVGVVLGAPGIIGLLLLRLLWPPL